MGTNYYATIIPSKERTKKLIKDISSGNFYNLQDEIADQYGIFDEETHIGGKFHLGKMSFGWKFLWDPNIYVRKSYDEKGNIKDISLEYGCYNLTLQAIEKFLRRPDVIISDEYCEATSFDEMKKSIDLKDSGVYSPDEFLKLTVTQIDVANHYLDGKSYYLQQKMLHDKFLSGNTDDLSPVELREASVPPAKSYTSELDRVLKKNGFKIEGFGDFYSDGLRFADHVNFS